MFYGINARGLAWLWYFTLIYAQVTVELCRHNFYHWDPLVCTLTCAIMWLSGPIWCYSIYIYLKMCLCLTGKIKPCIKMVIKIIEHFHPFKNVSLSSIHRCFHQDVPKLCAPVVLVIGKFHKPLHILYMVNWSISREKVGKETLHQKLYLNENRQCALNERSVFITSMLRGFYDKCLLRESEGTYLLTVSTCGQRTLLQCACASQYNIWHVSKNRVPCAVAR